MAIELRALSIGARAARLLGQRDGWHVEALFARSFYIRSGDAFICVGEPCIGNGPLNVIIDAMPAVRLGEACHVCDTAAKVWHIALSFEASGNRVISASLDAARIAAPPESLIHLLNDAEPRTSLERRARDGILALRRGDSDSAVKALAGLGHGLTPSGDDVLAGALLMLHALGRCDQAAALAEAVRRWASARTSPLSFALLEPACDGEPNEAVAKAIAAMLTGEAPEAVIHHLASVGATSGFDIFAGMLVAVEP